MPSGIAIRYCLLTYTSLILLILVSGFQSSSIPHHHDQKVMLFDRRFGDVRSSTIAGKRLLLHSSLSLSSSSTWDSLEGDFSSAILWEAFYRENPIESSTLEWHSSMPFNVLVDYCLMEDNNNNELSNCLMIGCGTSSLPDAFLYKSKTIQLTLLDSSQSCIDILMKRYGPLHPQISYICGSALELETTINPNSGDSNKLYDIILDKGLMDAFFCNDNWEDPIRKLLYGAKNCMKSSTTSRYILVSYQLPTGTQEYLNEISTSIGLSWQFNCTGSNNRVWISVATITKDI